MSTIPTAAGQAMDPQVPTLAHPSRTTMSRRSRIRLTTAALAVTGALATIGGTASAAGPFDIDPINVGSLPAGGYPAGFAGEVRFSDTLDSKISAEVTGTEWHNGGIKGCVRIVADYHNSAGDALANYVSPQQCTGNGFPTLPTLPRTVSAPSYSSNQLRSVRIRLQVKQTGLGETAFHTVDSQRAVANR